MNPEEIRRFLEEPGAHLILSPELTVLDAGPEYLRTTHVKLDQIVNRPIFEVLPISGVNRDGYLALMESYKRVINTGETDKLPIIRLDIQNILGDLVESYWRLANIPVSHEGKLQYIVTRFEDVTLQVASSNRITAVRHSNYLLYGLVLLVFGLGSWVLSHQISDNKAIAHRADMATHNATLALQATNKVLLAGRQQRLNALVQICNAVNAQDKQIRGLIILGAESTKPFSATLSALGFPPYSVRLAQARHQATLIKPIPDCFRINGKNKKP